MNFQALDAHIERSQMIEVHPDHADDEIEEEEGSIPCVTCGHEVSVKTCIKHMERCYNKVKKNIKIYTFSEMNSFRESFLWFLFGMIIVWESNVIWICIQNGTGGNPHFLWFLPSS